MNSLARFLVMVLISFTFALPQPPAPRAQQYVVSLPIIATSADVLAFTITGRFNRNQDIVVANEDGSDETILTHTADYEFATYPAWSPDGAYIAFALKTTYTSSLRVMQADGTGVRVLATVPITDSK